MVQDIFRRRMSLWSQIQVLPNTTKELIYQEFQRNFPEQIRTFVVHSIEENIWIDNKRDHHAKKDELIKLIEQKMNKENSFESFITSHQVKELLVYVRDTFPILVDKVKLFYEFVHDTLNEYNQSVHGELGDLSDLVKLKTEVEEFSQMTKIIQTQVELTKIALEAVNDDFNKHNAVHTNIHAITQHLGQMIPKIELIYTELDNIVTMWKRRYQLSLIELTMKSNLDDIHHYFQSTMMNVFANLTSVKNLLNYQMDTSQDIVELGEYLMKLENVVNMLFDISLVIEEQPTYFVQGSKKLSLSIRYLGSRLPGHSLSATVNIAMVAQDKSVVLSYGTVSPFQAFDLNINSKLNLDNLNISYFHKKVAHYVMEQLYYFQVQVQIIIGNKSYKVIELFSFPITTGTHANQRFGGGGALTWANYFSYPGESYKFTGIQLSEIVVRTSY